MSVGMLCYSDTFLVLELYTVMKIEGAQVLSRWGVHFIMTNGVKQ